MSSVNLNIRIDKEIKGEAERIFSELGLNMTTAVNLFLRKSIRDNGLPFDLKLSQGDITLAAIKEASKIANDPTVESYSNIADLKNALEK
ncbi:MULTISPECIES: type II toxin-antitoxin system RelB/DinJ family antitoxin [unclassified Lactobacillus]|uniref:type II toxin-antitoxin system RelB/DinJ family antitoxin n=1 Tax=unclassified Lactobacillus TaxID=2620435 RepID=UPI000EFC7364|nr:MULTISPECIES: type II toxin-antitoxin system RelB/DinJ family antitoxin [unclassified Lactobacillus]RMC25056.1 type II toxin-antitoxin system RelB/DinJ family antitoxin [Lactobacillus sp. ESL0247]RMC29211.1 type II toxin-antitoxin system RelB/DinJ family antitoxin [Lactobacillus sp. ESL0246]RMC32814.1 type II toxin-antitoxin system RelB/DinJ family antitoxin [Lactobacillus sp. ESL0245]RMC49765.1 type II toxin-antitoxin system RelB/DinJ family antitoxin [Lactobacillus sp. ESL0228]